MWIIWRPKNVKFLKHPWRFRASLRYDVWRSSVFVFRPNRRSFVRAKMEELKSNISELQISASSYEIFAILLVLAKLIAKIETLEIEVSKLKGDLK